VLQFDHARALNAGAAASRAARAESMLGCVTRPGGAGPALGLTVFTLVTALLVTLYPFHFQLGVASWRRIDWRLYYPATGPQMLVAASSVSLGRGIIGLV
jgi:hypothetical protein